MYNTNIAGIVDLTVVRKDGSEIKRRFTNAITDYGLDYLSYYFDTSTLVSSILFTQGSDEGVDVTKLSPAYVEGSIPLRVDNFETIKSTTMWEFRCNRTVETTSDGFYNPQTYTFDEINLMAPHATNKHDDIYEAVFAKCKIRDTDGSISPVTISEGERLIISYKLVFRLQDTTITETAPNRVSVIPPWIHVEVATTIPYSNYIRSSYSGYDDSRLYAKRVPYNGEGRVIAVDIQGRRNSTSGYDVNDHYLNLGVFQIRFNTYYTQLANADVGTKYHMLMKLDRYTPNETIPDGTHGSAVNGTNGQIKITAPPNSMVLVYDQDRMVTAFHLPKNTYPSIIGTYTLPTTYTYGWDTYNLNNRETLDCFLVTESGLKNIGTVNAVDSIAPMLTKGSWNEDATEFSFYCEPNVTYRAGLTGTATFWQNANLNGWTLGTDSVPIDSYEQTYLYSPTWTTVESEMGEPDPDKPTHRLVKITFPYPVKPHIALRITAADEYGNSGFTQDIYSGKTDYYPVDWKWNYFQERTLLTDQWDPARYLPSYLPGDTIMHNIDLLGITIEDIE